MADAAGRVRPRVSVRVRILATLLVSSALAMALAGGAWILLQRNRAFATADDTVSRDVAEFRALAGAGLDPTASRPFADVQQLLRAAMQRQVPTREETYLALVDGEAAFVPSGERQLRLEDEPAVLELAAGLEPDAAVVIRSADTSVGPVRWAAVQARVAGRPDVGTYVVAYGLAPSLDAVAEGGRLYALVAALSLLVVGVIGWLVSGRLLRPLRLLRDAAESISHADLTRRIPVSGSDDVSDLARTFNAMIGRLQSAFEDQQRFLDDAGHELRTPVTIVRGHLEVMDPDDAHEVRETRELAVDELDRMGRLVSDLVLLARSGRPDFVVPAPVDVARLTDDVAGKAAALGRRRWRVDELADVTVLADAQRLTQALLQLAHNAVRHTTADDTIALGSRLDGTSLRLWVRDTGEGVAPADAERIFERFGRGTSTGAARGDDGSGLGLAIVGAIAAGHGGRVVLRSVPGDGATFTLVLPVEVVPDDHPDPVVRIPVTAAGTPLEVS